MFVLCPSPHVGRLEEIPGGTQEQRGESGEVPGRTEEAAQEEPGQQEPLQVRGEGDTGEPRLRLPITRPHLTVAVDYSSGYGYCKIQRNDPKKEKLSQASWQRSRKFNRLCVHVG